MAKISLRAYTREIEGLIDHNQLDEAVAHCQYILKTYPKHLETYRLLGKAFLEAHRYAEAADIFQRVLNSVPDDFIAHLGMSLINDEQKDLNAAIWHMERAFEIQPSNPALQGELRRLYARRDGMEPHKIRLTRGALAQMYAKGEQYEQAIAEIRSVLAEDANRPDLQVLLARVYFRSAQKVATTEMCTALLKKYPYCLDANRIMVEILPGTDRAESTQVYRHRVNGLDPYSQFVTGSIFNVANVVDTAVTLEKYEWEPSAAVPAWADAARLGLEAGLGRDAQPEWLANPGDSPAPEAVADATPQAEDIPDWMRSAGWGASTGQAEEGPITFEEPMVHTADLAHADIPDWLRSMAPPGALAQQPGAIFEPADKPLAAEDLDFLKDLGVPDPKLGDTTLKQVPPSPPAPPPSAAPEPPSAPSAMARRLSGLSAESPESTPPPPRPEPKVEPVRAIRPKAEPPTQPLPLPAKLPGDVSDWLSSLGQDPQVGSAAPAPSEEFPSWLKDTGTLKAEADAAAESAKAADTLPDWLAPAAASAPPSDSVPESSPAEEPLSPLATGPGITESEQDDALAWLESLAAKQGAKSEELLTAPAERTEQAPDWVGQVDQPSTQPPPLPDVPPSASKPAASLLPDEPPLGELSPLASGPGVSESEQDDSLAWLESLAAKQGAKQEELITDPEARHDAPPVWVDQVDESAAAAPAAAAEDESLDWLQSLSQTPPAAVEEPKTQPRDAGATLPGGGPPDQLEWLQPLPPDEGSQPEAPQAAQDEPKKSVPSWVQRVEDAGQLPSESADDTLSWLNSLAAESNAAAADPAKPPQEDDTLSWLKTLAAGEPETTLSPPAVPDPATGVIAGRDISDWLQQLDEGEPTKPAAPAGVNSADDVTAPLENEEVPEWLLDPKETTGSKTPAESADIPEWLRSQSGDQVPPQPVPESKWMPEEGAPAMAGPAVAEPPVPAAPPAVRAAPPPSIPAPDPQPKAAAPAKPRSPAPPPSVKDSGILELAQTELARGNLEPAMQEYSKLIKRGKLLDEVIYDLRESLYRHPVDVVIWQTLGDAYMRGNRLQEALDAYTKAEELLR